eukprot:GFUD01108844.1.p1 GENE.GFUD01108844.1~~GFUD01108844.1.p1  ORF type:complete len:521 (-),score=180.54 GFUD01108844.1:2-1564(-)
MTKNTAFAKLLNNCMNRIDGTDGDDDDTTETASTKSSDNDSGVFTDNVETFSSNSNSPVRSEIKNIIDDKMKEKGDAIGSSEDDIKVDTLRVSLDVDGTETVDEEAAPEKAKILFSLKDFFERSIEIENNEDNCSDEEEKQSDEEDPSELDKNVNTLLKDRGDHDPHQDTANESDNERSDLKISKSDSSEKCLDNSKNNEKSDDENDPENAKGGDSDEASDLESELNILEKLKQKLEDGISRSTKGNGNDMDISEGNDQEKSSEVKARMETDDNSAGDDKKADFESEKTEDDKKPSSEENTKESNGSSSDPINIENTNKDEVQEKASHLKAARSIFSNISISIVGGNSKNINLESFLTKKPPSASTAPKPTHNIFQTGPNISIKRKSGNSPVKMFNSKRMKKSPILVSSDEDSSKKHSVPTVTLDEHSTIEDVSEDDEDTKPKENLARQYDNCTHGDPTDYMCVDCTYNRWRCEWEFVRPRKVKKTNPVQVNPVEIIQAVNWEKVFKFAGIGVEEEVQID